MLFLGGALALLVVLVVGIGSVKLLPGEPFVLRMNMPQQGGGMPALPGSELIVLFVRALLALSILLFPVFLVISILTREGRRRLLASVVNMLILFLLLSAMRNLAPNLGAELGMGQALLQPPPEAETSIPEAVFTANPPEWAVVALTIGVSLLLVGLGAGVLWLVFRKRPPAPTPMQQIAVEAQQAIDALETGGSLEETISRCYRDMCRVVQDRRGLNRDSAMTPSEFEQAMRANGLPRDAVHQLTHLFEDVRYGARQPGERERRQAIDSLTAIVAACGGRA